MAAGPGRGARDVMGIGVSARQVLPPFLSE
jgi:hypothetical protein